MNRYVFTQLPGFWSVVDYQDNGRSVCRCDTMAEAEMIAVALNNGTRRLDLLRRMHEQLETAVYHWRMALPVGPSTDRMTAADLLKKGDELMKGA